MAFPFSSRALAPSSGTSFSVLNFELRARCTGCSTLYPLTPESSLKHRQSFLGGPEATRVYASVSTSHKRECVCGCDDDGHRPRACSCTHGRHAPPSTLACCARALAVSASCSASMYPHAPSQQSPIAPVAGVVPNAPQNGYGASGLRRKTPT